MIFNIKQVRRSLWVEQESKKNLEFADIGYALLSGQIVSAGMGDDLLQSSKMGELFLGS